MSKLYALVLGLQEPEITKHCFGDCGKGILSGMVDEQLGALIPCAQDECPHLDRQMDKSFWTMDGETEVVLRRIKS